MSKALRARGHLIKILPEDQLKKMSTERLLNIHRKLTARMGFVSYHADPEQYYTDAGWAVEELATLKPFAETLHRIMATREHVERKA